MPSVAFVINRSLVRDPVGFGRRCLAAARDHGWEPVLAETSQGESGLGLARQAVTAGAGLVFAAGGDGTVRACAQALAGTGVPLAIVPLGTANLTARALGIPVRAGHALQVGFGGRDRLIDLVRVAEGGPGQACYAAMAGIGLDAAVVGAAQAEGKRRLGWVAYLMSGVAHLGMAPREFTVRLDGGEPLTRLARCVVVGNAGLLPGGFLLLPEARCDDGWLDVGILAPAGVLGWPRVAGLVLTHSRRPDGQLERFRARRVEITAETDLPRQVDGEVIAAGRTLTVSVCPGAVTVRVPGTTGRSG
jgi:diacylglycerol kinase family enzyme